MYDIYDLFRISLGERERGGEWEGEKERWKGRREEERRKETPSLSLLSPSISLPLSLPTLEKRRVEEKEGSEERSILCLVNIK